MIEFDDKTISIICIYVLYVVIFFGLVIYIAKEKRNRD